MMRCHERRNRDGCGQREKEKQRERVRGREAKLGEANLGEAIQLGFERERLPQSSVPHRASLPRKKKEQRKKKE